MNPLFAAQAGNQIGRTAAAAARSTPAVSSSPNRNSVSIGAPVFTTRPTSAGVASNLSSSLPMLAALGLAGVVVWRLL
tara:strand:- start:2005 stop:2238 length:234 start_codon:yes stop_codon:yes gene_type:complete